MTLLSQFVHQLPNAIPCACFLHCQQGFKVPRCRLLHHVWPRCLLERQTFGHPESDAFSLFLALRSRFRSGSNRFAASSATTSAKEFASMWWRPILFCVMTGRPTSSKCDLTLMTSVTPLRPSISWKKIDHKSPFGPCSKSPLCMMPLVTYFVSIGRLSAWYLSAWQLEGCVILRLQREGGHSKCDLSHILGSSRLPPEPSEATKTLSLAYSLKPLLSYILTSEHSASSLAGNQSRGKSTGKQNLICVPKFLRQCHKVV